MRKTVIAAIACVCLVGSSLIALSGQALAASAAVKVTLTVVDSIGVREDGTCPAAGSSGRVIQVGDPAAGLVSYVVLDD